MRKWASLATALVLVVASGCAEAQIDASSESAAEVSIQQVRDSFPVEKRAEFDQALYAIAFSSLGEADFMNPDSLDLDNLMSEYFAQIDGLTGEEVIEMAGQMSNERQAREQVAREISKLDERQQAAEFQRYQLDRFIVDDARFYFDSNPYSYRDNPVIELTVTNKTGEPVSRAYFRGVVSSPGRPTPWIDESFDHWVIGGLEPGKTAEWRLSPSSFSAWGNPDIPEDATLTVTAERLDGVDGEPLWDARGLSFP